MRRFNPTLLALAVGSLTTAPAFGQSNDKQQSDLIHEVQVIGDLSRYSALKSDTPIMETARSVSIEDQQDFIIKGAINLDDTFTYSSGVLGKVFGFATRGDWVKVRGLNAPLYQDSLQSLFGNYSNTRPEIYTLEQMEILKGPASVLYGKGSPGGIVNLVSKTPRADAAHEIVAELGSFDRRQLAFDSTGRIGGSDQWLYRAVGVYRDTDTQVDFVSDKTTVINPSITWRPGNDTNVTLLLNHTNSEGDAAAQFLPILGTLYPAPNGQFIENSTYLGERDFNHYNTEATSLTLLADHQINLTWGAELTARYSDAQVDYQQAWPAFIGGDRYVYNEDDTLYNGGEVPRSFYRKDSTSEQAAIDGRLRAEFETGGISHNVLIGAQYQDVTLGNAGYYAFAVGYDREAQGPDATFGDQYWINVFEPEYGNVPPQDWLDNQYAVKPESHTRDIGLYISDQLSIGSWRMTAGLRFDDTKTETGAITQSDDAVSASVGVLYQLASGLAPYASYAESFEPVIGDDGSGNPLKPQEGEQIEVGLKYQPSQFPAMFTLAWFDITQTNLNDPNAPRGTVRQTAEANISGIELEGMATLGDFSIELNASNLTTESASGDRLASIPESQASTWVTWRPSGEQGFKAGAGVRYVGESYGGNDQIKTPAYTLGDLMVGYKLENWDFTLNARNVTDKEFQSTCLARGDCFPGEARTVVARVRFQL